MYDASDADTVDRNSEKDPPITFENVPRSFLAEELAILVERSDL